jgi:hypothetical protein
MASEFQRRKIAGVFAAMDADRDDRVTLDEVMLVVCRKQNSPGCGRSFGPATTRTARAWVFGHLDPPLAHQR